MVGGSYLGIAQWKVAVLNNPNLKAIFPVVSGCDDYLDRFYSPGGAMKLGHRLLWLSENLRAQGSAARGFQLVYQSPAAAHLGQGRHRPDRVPLYQTALESSRLRPASGRV